MAFTHIPWLEVELLRCRLACGSFPNICPAAGCLPRDGDPVAADSCLEHRDPAVQPGPVPRGWAVVWSRHELRPPPGDAAGELPETGSTMDTTGLKSSTKMKMDFFRNRFSLFFPLCVCRCQCFTVKYWTGWAKARRSSWKCEVEPLSCCCFFDYITLLQLCVQCCFAETLSQISPFSALDTIQLDWALKVLPVKNGLVLVWVVPLTRLSVSLTVKVQASPWLC